MKQGLLCSGMLGYSALEHLQKNRHVSFVCTDTASVDIQQFCEQHQMSVFTGNPRNGRIDAFLEDKEIDLLLSVNYLFIIEPKLIRLPKILAFNIHGSLLPKYRGRTPHVWAIINGESETGITAHLIEEGVDTGDIILQKTIPITRDDTGASVLQKYHKAYIPLIEEVLTLIESGAMQLTKQDASKATYFGKRTPEDGQINWNWQKERIRNWVRAQAHPYPGAFTMIEGNKVVIDRIDFTDYGYHNHDPNGLIQSADPILVKTPNGVVELSQVREGKAYLRKGQIAQSCI